MYSLKYKLETTKKQIPVLNTCLEDVANSTIRTVHTKNAQKTQKNMHKKLVQKTLRENWAQKKTLHKNFVQSEGMYKNFVQKKSAAHFFD